MIAQTVQKEIRPPSRVEYFKTLIACGFSDREITTIAQAYEFSKYGHYKQKRDDGTRYFDHPKYVAWYLFYECQIKDASLIIEALLHDVREDSHLLTFETIEQLFGLSSAQSVECLSKQEGDKDISNSLQRIIDSEKHRPMLIKTADRLHNLRTLSNCSEEKQVRKIAETKKYFFIFMSECNQYIPPIYSGIIDKMRKEMMHICDSYS